MKKYVNYQTDSDTANAVIIAAKAEGITIGEFYTRAARAYGSAMWRKFDRQFIESKDIEIGDEGRRGIEDYLKRMMKGYEEFIDIESDEIESQMEAAHNSGPEPKEAE
jgi:hypothetical protein